MLSACAPMSTSLSAWGDDHFDTVYAGVLAHIRLVTGIQRIDIGRRRLALGPALHRCRGRAGDGDRQPLLWACARDRSPPPGRAPCAASARGRGVLRPQESQQSRGQVVRMISLASGIRSLLAFGASPSPLSLHLRHGVQVHVEGARIAQIKYTRRRSAGERVRHSAW
jgi:hypothetical protein